MSVNSAQSPTTDLTSLNAVSPLDGRYARHTAPLRAHVSEYALIRYRLVVEIEWLKALAAEPRFEALANFPEPSKQRLARIAETFDEDQAAIVKSIEATTNHDVKAVEYYLQQAFAGDEHLVAAIPFVHFACTSEDINNLAYSLMLRDARDRVVADSVRATIDTLRRYAHQFAAAPMLSRTHGQTATPTSMGKELANVVVRLERQLKAWEASPTQGKINGAVGNYNAHVVACPGLDWTEFAAGFVGELGLEFNAYTTQIEPHDCIAEYAHALSRLNTVAIDLCRDVWTYISLGYFRQRKLEHEVGSSTMPHKVNPIDFENAEGNFGLGNALLEHLAAKLPISRMQRDLTDSTVLRNVGGALAYSLIALRSLQRGLEKLELNEAALAADLEGAWEVLAEPVQTVMRAHGIADSYEQLKALTRGQKIDREALHRFIDGLELPAAVRDSLKALRPETYTGLASRLAGDV